MLEFIWDFWSHTWFIWVFAVLLPFTESIWTAWRQKHFEHNIKWAMLEMLIPREIVTSPKAMEQVLLQLHSFKNYPANVKEKYLLGEVTRWHSFEIVGIDGEVHFYIRTPMDYRDIVEAALFAYYPDIEIEEAEDYMKRFPKTIQALYGESYRMWGTELRLEKSAAYPIRDYTQFESPDENKEYDPISGIIELFSKLKVGQMAAIQILVQPAASPHDKHEIEEYKQEVVKVRERKGEAAHAAAPKLKLKFHGGILPTLEPPSPEEEAGLGSTLKKAIMTRTPGETNILEAMEESLAQPMFNTIIRYIYASPFEFYSEHLPRRAIFGAFNAYGATNINAFKRNSKTQTRGKMWEWPFIFPDIRKEYRRQRIWYDFRNRELPPHNTIGRLFMSYIFSWHFGSKTMHLSPRSLATVWHPPTHAILTGPHIRRIESKKMGPPAGVEIYGAEDQITKFQ